MSIEAGIYSCLSIYAGLTSLVSTRIYPLVIPQDCDFPAVCYRLISDVPEYILSQAIAVQNARFQISSFATTLDSARSVATQVKAALLNLSGAYSDVTIRDVTVENESDLYEPDTGIYHVPVDFMVTYV